MRQKGRRADFSRQLIPLAACPECRGLATTLGLFGPRPCMACNVSGWVDGATGKALPLEDLVMQLGMRLRALQQQVDRQRAPSTGGPAEQYQTNNRRGAGGTNYTGD